ncbi:class I SAM-dependent methyltransferase [Gloeocapsopsis dulcis]|uniref:SAM-dependent methyltransferase n=1 Tax=Gloeocapsopsis dulcis AAB1 = 1H9 TaxID=1433147 RepID=A0A6N8FZK1_9CHRO|nr:class I SAM-dependent methyltransferase [Gloeocapsopsis dulcis]MUL38590.1 SAM-dependent methyltransferase [Gloeocapsopsis dulcis AAB1 = 1H9]WNN91150.1 methyltransferase domain-containing protein [Gloeocapsopsis dulcis]
MVVSSDILRFPSQVFRKVKSVSKRAYLAYPKIVECNLCGWQGRHFISDCWHPYTICPECHSEVRHRLFVATLSSIDGLTYKDIVQNKKVLHFAPEKALKSIFPKYANKYVTADYLVEGLDMKLDISNMSSVQDGAFDLVVACDVLEHVPNDTKAMQEIYRVLSVGGYAIITVPQQENLKQTFEDSTIVSPEEREKVFGQWDHLRIYGDNFPSLLESVGFTVTVVNETNFSQELVNQYVLFPPVLSENPLATNYRKIFFAHKS